MTLGQRLKQIAAQKQINTEKMATLMGVTKPMIYDYYKGKSIPGQDKIEALLSSIPKINPTWLIQGKGEMFLDELQGTEANEPFVSFRHENLDLFNFLNLVEEVKRLRDRVSALETQLYNQNQKK